MSNSFNVDIAVECLKNLVDSNRCVICDKPEGSRLRYPTCGHTSCDHCADKTLDCVLCLTPPGSSRSRPVLDDPLTQRAKNASKLLEACQEAFHVDVYRRQRRSEQLKTEKELFPECIQAPHKYFNKRKSSIGSLKNKENKRHSIFPGEQISPYKGSKMEKSTYIKQWIEQTENAITKSPRKPFADLNLNCQRTSPRHSTPIKKRVDVMLDKVHENIKSTRKLTTKKRSHFKTTLSMVNNQSKLDKYLKDDKSSESISAKRLKRNSDQHKKIPVNRLNKHSKDESGIVADIDTFVIEDSQSEDKDKQAWLAVLEAEKDELNSSSPIRLECSEILKNTDDLEITSEFPIRKESTVCNKVPFYKKSCLLEQCKHCVDNNKPEFSYKETHSKDVSITIENNYFVTTVKVSNKAHSYPKTVNKHSIPIQTDINGLIELDNKGSQKIPETEQKHSNKVALEEPQKIANIEDYPQSQDLFTGEAKTLCKQKSIELFENDPKGVIVSDSDSDGEAYPPSIIQVKADVHRSSDQLDYGILAELDENEVQVRTRHSNRGTTPGSTDSSEKENYNPNRQKRMKFSKKDLKKKMNSEKKDLLKLDSIFSLKE